MTKLFRYQHGCGHARHIVSFHDGVKLHDDGSPFFDIRICKNKQALSKFLRSLIAQGYVEQPCTVTWSNP